VLVVSGTLAAATAVVGGDASTSVVGGAAWTA
jgi:hypothetical protein